MRTFRTLNALWMALPCLALACAAESDNSPSETTSGVSATTDTTAPPVTPPPANSSTPVATNPPPTGQPPTPVPTQPEPTPPASSETTAPTTSTAEPTSGADTSGDEVSGDPTEPAGSASGEETSAAPDETTDEPAPGGWQPCKSNPCVVLPLGDSITDGVGASGGGSYRIKLFSLALADGKALTYVGGLNNGPQMVDGVTFPRAHEGHSGWTIQQIDDLLFKNAPPVAISSKPEIVLLHIGTNDMWNGPNGAPDRLGALIDKLIGALPDSLIAVAKIIPWPTNAGLVDTYNAGLVSEVTERIDAGKHVILVDQFAGFPTNTLDDGIHPNAAGYEVMAAKWYESIGEYLPAAK